MQVAGDERKLLITTQLTGLVILNWRLKHVLSTLHMTVFHILDLNESIRQT
jgi:hypothetical protein